MLIMKCIATFNISINSVLIYPLYNQYFLKQIKYNIKYNIPFFAPACAQNTLRIPKLKMLKLVLKND